MLKTSQAAEHRHLFIGTAAAVVGIAILAVVTYLTWSRDPLQGSHPQAMKPSPTARSNFSGVHPVNPAAIARQSNQREESFLARDRTGKHSRKEKHHAE